MADQSDVSAGGVGDTAFRLSTFLMVRTLRITRKLIHSHQHAPARNVMNIRRRVFLVLMLLVALLPVGMEAQSVRLRVTSCRRVGQPCRSTVNGRLYTRGHCQEELVPVDGGTQRRLYCDAHPWRGIHWGSDAGIP